MKLRIPEKITEDEIKKFQQIFRRINGKPISKKEAKDEILNMLGFIASIIEK